MLRIEIGGNWLQEPITVKGQAGHQSVDDDVQLYCALLVSLQFYFFVSLLIGSLSWYLVAGYGQSYAYSQSACLNHNIWAAGEYQPKSTLYKKNN